MITLTGSEKNKKWGLDDEKVEAIQWVYEEYVKKDRSLQQIDIGNRFDFSITYSYLITVLKERCGTHWEVNFKAEDKPFPFKVPRILSDHKIQAIKDRLAHNNTSNRSDVKGKYLLAGFIRCMHCGKSLHGQAPHGGKYKYYRHPGKLADTCDAFGSVPLDKIEHAVFQTIFENIYDAPTFEKAIKDSLPDEDLIKKLENKIETKKERKKKVKKKRQKLVDAVLNDTLEEDSIKETDKELKETEERLDNEIDNLKYRLDNLPDPVEVKKEAHQERRRLKRKYQSEEHLQSMSFHEKKQLLHFLFDGKAPNGDDYGIYIDKRGKGKDAEIDCFMFGCITGLRTIKGDDIDYFPEEDDDDNRNGGNSSTPKNHNSHRNLDYKTNNFATSQKGHFKELWLYTLP